MHHKHAAQKVKLNRICIASRKHYSSVHFISIIFEIWEMILKNFRDAVEFMLFIFHRTPVV